MFLFTSFIPIVLKSSLLLTMHLLSWEVESFELQWDGDVDGDDDGVFGKYGPVDDELLVAVVEFDVLHLFITGPKSDVDSFNWLFNAEFVWYDE